MEMEKMKFAVIGYGGMGGWHTKYIGGSDVAALAGVYDIKPERNELAESRGIHAYASLDEALNDPAVQQGIEKCIIE